MINTTLFKKEIKSNYILLLIFSAVLTVYGSMIVAMFEPKMSESLKAMAESMPDIFAAFGMKEVGATLMEFITGYLYNMLYIAFPSVFLIILANRLVAKYVDNGSMAYLLAVPDKRRRIISTQAVFLIGCLFLMVAYITGLILFTSHMMFPGKLDTADFLRVNVGLLGLLVFLGGICFLFSCLFNETRLSTSIGTGIVVYSILAQMLARVGDKFEVLKYATPLTLYDLEGLIAMEQSAWIGCAILYAGGLLSIVVGCAVFTKRNLPI